MSRDAILARVRAALTDVTPPPLAPLSAAPAEAPAALLERFVAEARAVGTEVYTVAHADAAADVVVAIARATPGARYMVTWPAALAATVAHAAGARLPEGRLTVLDGATPAATVAEADIGVTEADCLVAASGTLVLRAAGRHRGASLLPPIHVAVAPIERLVPDLGAALRWVRSGAPPVESCVTLITGPSRTADIEKKLVLGVHGPCALHVILLGGTASAPGAHSP